MVGRVDHAGLTPFVVTAEEIVRRLAAEIRGRTARVFMIRDVGLFTEVGAVIVAGSQRIGRTVLPVVELHRFHVRREDQPVLLVHRHRRILPPEEGMPFRRAVVELHAGLKTRLARREEDPDHALHAVQRLVVAHPDRDRAAFVLFHRDVHGHERARPVMAGPVEFHAARDPVPQHADQRRLDHMLVIKKVVAVPLVRGRPDPSAERRHQFDL